MENRPIIKIKRDKMDVIIETVTILALLITFLYPAFYYSYLPENIPAHFNFSGEVDRYDHKSWVWLLPIISLVLNTALYFLNKKPHLFNYVDKITAENAEENYRSSIKIMRFTGLVISILFLIITYQTVTLGLSGAKKTPVWSEYLIYCLLFILTFGTLGYVIYKSRKN